MVMKWMGRRAKAAAAVASMLALVATAACSSGDGQRETGTSPGMETGDVDLAAAVQAYVYTYPLVSVEVTRRQSTNIAAPDPARGAAPMNQLAPLAFLPDASFTGVVRPNIDTLYTSMFFDVSEEPLIVGVPPMGERYHLFPLLDMWTNIDAAPGTRTLEDAGAGYEFAIVGPDWEGDLPDGVHEYRLATDAGWMIGRIQVDGPEDVPAVIDLQNAMTAVPLSAHGTAYEPPVNTDLRQDWPVDQEVARHIHDLSPQQYWDLYYSALSHDQPRPGDQAVLDQLAAAGWSPTERLDLAGLPEEKRAVWEQAWPEALRQIEVDLGSEEVNGWLIARTDMGDYGTNYAARAVVAHGGLGANLPADAIYPAGRVDAAGDQLNGDNAYVLRFAADEVPPVRAFWSLTLYDDRGFFVDNPADRYALRGERLTANPDGSVDIYVQSQSPGPDKEANWLPAPDGGDFNLMLRLYWPEAPIVDGDWNPPAVVRQG